MENIINLQTRLQTAQVANNRLNEVYLVTSEFEEKKTVEDLSMMKGDMTFKRVHYKYGYGRDVLSDINLTIPAKGLRWLFGDFRVRKDHLGQDDGYFF